MRFWKYKKKKKREKQTNKRKRKRRKEVRRIYNARLDTVLWLEGGNGIRWTVACEKIVAKKSRRKSLAFLFSVVAVARLAHVVAIRAPPRWKIDATGRPSDDLGPVPTDAASGCRVPSQPFPPLNIAVSTMMTTKRVSTRLREQLCIPWFLVRRFESKGCAWQPIPRWRWLHRFAGLVYTRCLYIYVPLLNGF